MDLKNGGRDMKMKVRMTSVGPYMGCWWDGGGKKGQECGTESIRKCAACGNDSEVEVVQGMEVKACQG